MIKKYLIKGSFAAALFLLLVWSVVFYIQRGHFIKAEQYYFESSWKLAVREYDAAMHMYTPRSPYIRRSAERLWQIGEMFEKEERFDWAVNAYAAIRSSFYASRSFYTPGWDWIKRCEDRIAELNVKMLIREGTLKPEEGESEKYKMLYVMSVDRTPAVGWTALMEACFFGWIASVIFIIIKGFDARGKVRPVFVLCGGISFLLTFGIWALALWKA